MYNKFQKSLTIFSKFILEQNMKCFRHSLLPWKIEDFFYKNKHLLRFIVSFFFSGLLKKINSIVAVGSEKYHLTGF